MSNLINIHTYIHTYIRTYNPWEDQCEWHRMTRITGPECVVMCNLRNIHTYIHAYIHTYIQTNRGVGGLCVGVVPRIQSKLSRALHAHLGKKLLQDLQTQESTAMKRAMVRFRGAREKCAMAFVECLVFSQEDTTEDPLWRETLGRSLGSHDATELVGGMCHGNGCRQETTRLHAISCTKTGWSSLTHNRVLHQALARSLRESKVQFVVEDTWPFRQKASEQNGRLNKLRMDITTEGGHSSTTTLDSRIRHFYSTLPSSTLAPAPIWGMQHAM